MDWEGAKRGALKKFQSDSYTTRKILSYGTKRTEDCFAPPGNIYISCHSSNVIESKSAVCGCSSK